MRGARVIRMKLAPYRFLLSSALLTLTGVLVAGPLSNPPYLPPDIIAPVDIDLDTDNDGIPDYWERIYELDPDDPNDASLDPDVDGLTSLQEYEISAGITAENPTGNWVIEEDINYQVLEPIIKDVGKSLNPNDPDTDRDLATDGWEYLTEGRDPKVADAPELPDVGEDEIPNALPEPVFVADFEGTLAGTYINDPLQVEEHPIYRFGNTYQPAIEGKGVNGYFRYSPSKKVFPDGMSVSVWMKPNFSSGTTLHSSYPWISIFDIGNDDAAMEKYDEAYLGVVLQRDTLLIGTHFNDGNGYKERLLTRGGFSGGTKYREYKPISILKDQWYHLVLTYSGTKVQLFVNGVLLHEMDAPKPWVTGYPPRYVTFNQIYYRNRSYYVWFDSLKIFNRVVSQVEVLDLLEIDTDGDLLHDYWEINSFGSLTYTDNPDGDEDGDGLLNKTEQLQGLLSSGNSIDTDGDGLSDYLEAGGDASEVLLSDSDGDGLSDSLEAELGTNSRSSDSDGDGLDDAFEHTYELDPNVNDSLSLSLVQQILPRNYSSALGQWFSYYPDSDKIRTVSERGRLTYDFSVPESGMYVIRITGHQTNTSVSLNTFDFKEIKELELYVDGKTVGSGSLNINYGNDQQELFMTPYLEAGGHDLRIDFSDILDAYPKCHIENIEILSVSDGDSNGNDIPDWCDAYLSKINAPTSYSLSTNKSPCFIEGTARYPSEMLINEELGAVESYTAGTHQWYSYVPLHADDVVFPYIAAIEDWQTVSVDFQQGYDAEFIGVEWRAHNLYLDDAVVYVQPGDCVKFTAFEVPEDVPTMLYVDGQGVEIVSSSQAVVYKFDDVGEHVVTATIPGKPTKEVSIIVVSYQVGQDAIAIRNNKSRSVDLNRLPDNVTVEATGDLMSSVANTSSSTRYTLKQSHAGLENLLVRLPGTGEIIENIPVITFETSYSGESSMRILSTDDGIQTLQGKVFVRNLPDWVEAHLEIFISGVQFADGTTKRILTSDDFSELGVYEYKIFRPAQISASACHRTYVYDTNFATTRNGRIYYFSFGSLAH
ncbi:MAG: hypothetical protein CML13_06655 [Puniceicoccaceae bacterium]|nr:hypothetical protein [Puniceicoccaceae bacterium]|tara:strand:- start:18078 stop:21215 length:3138 start_codon:yes stop_codon:yes gene_type:complete